MDETHEEFATQLAALRAVGFDSRSETLADPSRVRPATMTGCGSVHCS